MTVQLLNVPEAMPDINALREAIAFLEEEANQLSKVKSEGLSNRAQIAISREIARLRLIARTLSKLPQHKSALCLKCGGYPPGHATGGADLCTCEQENENE